MHLILTLSCPPANAHSHSLKAAGMICHSDRHLMSSAVKKGSCSTWNHGQHPWQGCAIHSILDSSDCCFLRRATCKKNRQMCLTSVLCTRRRAYCCILAVLVYTKSKVHSQQLVEALRRAQLCADGRFCGHLRRNCNSVKRWPILSVHAMQHVNYTLRQTRSIFFVVDGKRRLGTTQHAWCDSIISMMQTRASDNASPGCSLSLW